MRGQWTFESGVKKRSDPLYPRTETRESHACVHHGCQRRRRRRRVWTALCPSCPRRCGRPGCDLCFTVAEPRSHSQRVTEPRLRAGPGGHRLTVQQTEHVSPIRNWVWCSAVFFKSCFSLQESNADSPEDVRDVGTSGTGWVRFLPRCHRPEAESCSSVACTVGTANTETRALGSHTRGVSGGHLSRSRGADVRGVAQPATKPPEGPGAAGTGGPWS